MLPNHGLTEAAPRSCPTQESAFERAARRVQTIVPLLRGSQRASAAEAAAAAQAAADAERAMADQQALQEHQDDDGRPSTSAAATASAVSASGSVIGERPGGGAGWEGAAGNPEEAGVASTSAATVEELARQAEGWWGHPAVQAAAGGARRVAQARVFF